MKSAVIDGIQYSVKDLLAVGWTKDQIEEHSEDIRYKLSMPYMGSKQKLAQPIIEQILYENPGVKHLYDLFGGGGAISLLASQIRRFESVTYNELNPAVYDLLRILLTDGFHKHKDTIYRWISREEFHELKHDKTWIGGIATQCWSFGQGQESYLYSKHNEILKEKIHRVVVDGINEPNELVGISNIAVRKRKYLKYLKENDVISRLEHIERIDRLEHIEPMYGFNLTNSSYEDVSIHTPTNNTVIYLDPPYINTKKYKHGVDLCYDSLSSWIKNSPYKIYMSSYEPIDGCDIEVLSIDHKSTLSSTNNSKRVKERLFTNTQDVLL